MSKAAICVVVPVYKAMATLDRCVESVLAQQVEGGLTCILVDDGSPDESGALCDAWAAKDDRVTVIHQDDLGVSGARNSGLAAADSEFIVFLDSDDALRPGALQAALTAQRAAPQDFVVWHYTTDEKDPAAVTADAEPRPQAGLARLWLDCLLAMPWNKLYRADLAKQLQFDVQYTLGEDLQFVLDYIALLGQTVPEFGYRVMTSPLTFYDCSRAPRQALPGCGWIACWLCPGTSCTGPTWPSNCSLMCSTPWARTCSLCWITSPCWGRRCRSSATG